MQKDRGENYKKIPLKVDLKTPRDFQKTKETQYTSKSENTLSVKLFKKKIPSETFLSKKQFYRQVGERKAGEGEYVRNS